MDRIAFVLGDTFLYWNSIVITLAAAAAICFFLAFYLGRGGKGAAAAVAVPMAMVLSIFLSRLAHWYFRPDGYTGFGAAMTDFTTGGYALMGVLLGCFLTAVVMRLVRLESSLLRMVDAMCIGGSAGIALGRLACFFSSADRGMVLANLKTLPWAYPVTNAVTGALEYRLATFMIQAMATGAVFVVLTVLYFFVKTKRGELTLFFLLLYGLCQAILDSTRYDSLYMRSNGFISMEQLLGAVSMVFACVMFSIRLVRSRGFRVWYVPVWIVMAGLMGGAGYMEYYVQRHGNLALFSYSIMTACLSTLALIAIILYACGTPKTKRKFAR